jgi:hypothetical protein
LLGYGLKQLFRPSDALSQRLEMYRFSLEWNRRIDPVRFVELGEEPADVTSAMAQKA